MVLVTLNLKLKKTHHQKSPSIRFDIEKLKDPEMVKLFYARICGKFAALNLFEEDINVLTDNIKGVVRETATEVLRKERKKIQPLITNDILDFCDIRRNMKKTNNSNPETMEQYRTVNYTNRTQVKKAEEKWILEQCDNIEKGIKEGNSKKAFDTLKKLKRKQQHKATVIEGKNSSLLTDNAAVLTR